MSEEREAKQESGDPNQMSIKVVSSDGQEVFFKIKNTTRFSKLKGAYAQRVGKAVETIRFVSDGSRVTDDDTPESLGLEVRFVRFTSQL
ncbi:ubiquitin-related domain-containing protein [Mrakia frigida]|uniref:ubiquitin-related domain-containing protein n=1 Tax=Mrakia frigida TaxID=29902 RepID=UPI003FCBEE72